MKIVFIFIALQSILLASFSGIVIDNKTNKPVSNAMISDPYHSVKSDENGSFYINSNSQTYHVKAHGYRLFSFSANLNTTKLYIEPITIKALYLTFWGANIQSKTLKRILKIIEDTDVNTIIVDVKNEYGSTSYKTSFNQANKYGAWHKRTIKDMKQFMNLMKSKNIYTIARVVVFKDELQAKNNPDYAIKKLNGKPWRNYDEIGWVDPFDTRSHDYTISIAEDAAQVGFDEINFDYIRFPAKKRMKLLKKNTKENRIMAINDFLDTAKDRLRKHGVFISVNTYGNICWSKGDNNIGQTVESLAEHADYLSPMLYPSGFASGSFLLENPSEHPYAVIHRSIDNITDRIDSKRIRPWLQHFKDYAHKKRHYLKFEVQEQIRACNDINTSGWMMWSPSSKYNTDYFEKTITKANQSLIYYKPALNIE